MKHLLLLVLICVGTSVAADTVRVTPDRVQPLVDACNAGNANACQTMGSVLRSRSDAPGAGLSYNPANALQFYERGCALGDIGACTGVGRILTNGGGKNSDFGLLDLDRGRAVLNSACQAGSRSACDMLTRLN